MNYFAHGRDFVGEPYVLAGTAVPDWLNVVNRRAKARSRLAQPYTCDTDPMVAAIARGIVQHHRDDRWFHQSRVFAELSLEFTVQVRDRLPRDEGFRPSFLGHILVELLLDAALIEADPPLLDVYYDALQQIDPEAVARVVDRMCTQPAGMLALFILRFSEERFLYDYGDDERLLFRLNNVMRRVRLPSLPASLLEFFPAARTAVRRRIPELLGDRSSA